MKRLAVAVLVLLVCGCSRGPSPAEKREAALRLYDLESKALERTEAKLAGCKQSLAELRSASAEYSDIMRQKSARLKGTPEQRAADDELAKVAATTKDNDSKLTARIAELEGEVAKQKAKVAEAKKALDSL
jgi:uncharacterized coiled-coil protein SlyX